MKDLPDICLEVENSLPLWVGGDLDADASSAVREHLARCTRCGALASRAHDARTALRAGLAAEARNLGPGPDLWRGIRAALQAEGLVGSAPATVTEALPDPAAVGGFPARRRFQIRRMTIGMPLAAAVLVGLFLAGNWMASEGSGLDRKTPAPVANNLRTDGGVFVAQPVGLRKLSPGEVRLRDTAHRLEPIPLRDVIDEQPQPNNLGSPAGFERLQRVPPR